MNFFREIDRLQSKYENRPEHAEIANDYLTLITTYLQQLKSLAAAKQKEKQP